MNPHVYQLLLNLLTKDGIPITNEILRHRIVRKCVNKLLADQFGGWMCGCVEVEHFPSIMSQNKEDVENEEGNCRYSKEIDGDKFPAMVFQERPPRLRGRFDLSHHVFGNGCLRDTNTKLEQFPRGSEVRPGAGCTAKILEIEVVDFMIIAEKSYFVRRCRSGSVSEAYECISRHHSLRLVSETLRMAFLQSIRFEIDNNFVCRIRKSGDRLSLLSFHLFECVDRLKSIVHICTPAPLNFFNPEEKGS